MTLPVLLQLAGTAIMVIGVAFGIQNIRQYQASRKRESAVMMLNSFQTRDFVQGLLYVLGLPDDVSMADMRNLPEDHLVAIYMVIGTWERLGMLVYRGEIDFQLVDEAFSGPIVQSWRKLGRYIGELRADIGRETAMEWFQWLAELELARETQVEPVPAYIAHRGWRPSRR